MEFRIFLQLLWVIGLIFWNLTGLDLKEAGEALPLPIPSWTAIMTISVIGILLAVFHNSKYRGIYKMVSLIASIYAAFGIFQAFSIHPDLWENKSRQWGGLAINIFGFLAGLAGVFVKSFKGYRPDPVSPFFNESAKEKEG